MHAITLLDLDWIEKNYCGKPVVVIGVHSAKFYNDQEVENIKEAIGRYEISHSVIVDKDMAIWQSCKVSGWPTLVVMDPKANVVYHQSGEGQRQYLDDVISVLIERHSAKGTLAEKPLEIKKPATVHSGILSYPGKLSFSPDGKMLAISYSNHNRIVVVDADGGKIIYKVGSGGKRSVRLRLRAGPVLSASGSVVAQPRQDLCRRQRESCIKRDQLAV